MNDVPFSLRAAAIALPPALAAAGIGLSAGAPPVALWALPIALVLSALLAVRLHGAVGRKLHTLSGVLSCFREGDFSIRARAPREGALFSAVLDELNGLGGVLREQRLSKIESWTLLRKVLEELDVVVLAFDEQARVRLCNEAAAGVLGSSASALLGRPASELGLAELLHGSPKRLLNDCAALGGGAWDLRRSGFRLAGEPHALLVLSDLGGALRHQERQAWKRLTAVLGHEINNSLAPIQSISENLLAILTPAARGQSWERDVVEGLSTVNRRAQALGRFTASYAKLWRLPAPKLAPLEISDCVQRAAKLERRAPIDVVGGPPASVLADADQLEQLLINLLKNAVDASLECDGGVRVRWSIAGRKLDLTIEDDGPGLSDTGNLFVPFFTTKPGGSGIGLALARQIAEAHGGHVALRSRTGASGAEAVLELPLRQ